MANFTVAIPDDLLVDAKVAAAKCSLSLNAVLRQLLEGFVRNESLSLCGNYEILFRYSLGLIAEDKAIETLHLDRAGDLKVMTIAAGLPMPRLSAQETEEMQKTFGAAMDNFSKAA